MEILAFLNKFDAKTIACENVALTLWISPVITNKTCNMRVTTSINDSTTTISTRDDSVNALDFAINNKIYFLPIQINETFPNLLTFNAYKCSLRQISKENFSGLKKLIKLYLYSNQIEEITSESFEDLVSLEELWLREIPFCFNFVLVIFS